jgi:signal transduction histidine kinase
VESPEKTYKCKITGLQVLERWDFTNIDIGNGYKVTLTKIGNSIIHSTNRGNMRFTNVEKYYSLVEAFIMQTGIEKPYVEIRDFRHLKGRSPSRQIQLQVKYLRDHEHEVAGMIVCNARGVMEIVIRSAFKLIKTPMRLHFCKDYETAIKKAASITHVAAIESKSLLNVQDISFKPEWHIKNENFSITNGIIPGRVFFSALNGNFQPEDMPVVQESLEIIFSKGDFTGKEYIRIADYTELGSVKLRTRNIYAKIISDLNKKYQSRASATYLCGASRFIKAAMQIWSVTSKQEINFVNTLEEAFDLINDNRGSNRQKTGSILVNQQDMDEIIYLGGSLIWGNNTGIDELVSKKNPLYRVAETLSVVQSDLIELRENDVEQNKVLSDSLEKMATLAEELQKRDEETRQLNEELRTANDQLFSQKEELEFTKIQLLKMNNTLENMVKERTEKLRTTVDKLNKSVSELDRFVYSASHDLSAPLKSILGLLHIARKDPDKTQTEKYLQYIENSIHNLEGVIKSLISYSRNSRMEVKNEPLDLLELVNEVIAELAFLPSADLLDFRIEIPDKKLIHSDRQRLKVVLHNLIGNSVKYADYDKANPFVHIQYEKDGDDNVIKIIDNGIGIAPEQLERVFEMFYRGTEKSKGSGLGLFIVKETISVMNGDIEVRSTPGEETIFTVTIPA